MKLAAGILGLIAYFPLIAGIVGNKVQQSFAAFLLWAMLDTIATATTFLQDGNYWLPLSNVVGATTVAVLLAWKRQVSWTWVENVTTVLVLICLIAWYTSGEVLGIVASSLAVVAAGIPQAVDTFRNAKSTPMGSYLIFLAANTLSFFAGEGWSIQERFYAGCSMFLCLSILMLAVIGRSRSK